MWGSGLFLGVTGSMVCNKNKLAKIEHIAPQNDPLPHTQHLRITTCKLRRLTSMRQAARIIKTNGRLKPLNESRRILLKEFKFYSSFFGSRISSWGPTGARLFLQRCVMHFHKIKCSAFICSFVLLVLCVLADVKLVIGTPVSAKQPKVVKSHF